MMNAPFPEPLVHLRGRPDTLYVRQGRVGLVTRTDGFFDREPEKGFFVLQTRMLSRYGWKIDGAPPSLVALSNVDQHSWLGYYILLAPGFEDIRDPGSGNLTQATQQALELRLSRYVGEGMHEDVDLTNYTLRPVAFHLTLEVDADFADLHETGEQPRPDERLER